jgi:hypothetical protein
MIRVDVRNSREYQALILAIRSVPKELQANIRQYTKAITLGEWREAVNANVTDRPQAVILAASAKVAVSNQNIRLSAGTAAKKLRRGGPAVKDLAAATEFGADRSRTKTYTSRRGSKSFVVHNRHTTRQLRPVNRSGYVFYPAVAVMVPRIFALWAQTAVRTFLDAIDGKGK